MPKTNLAAKSALARLMAAENIAVEVDASAQTACFNVEERRLTLPLWDVEGDAYDMLVGHEVSHALYTPEGAESLKKACDAIDPKNYGVAKDYLNVVEDARIERLIKVDYPGLRRSFAAGYREFNARDLFGIKGKDVGGLGLIDRINLHYKIGWLLEVPFSDAELPLVQRVAETRSWDEVVSLTKEIYEFAKNQNENGEENKPEPQDGEGEASAPSGSDTEEADGQESEADGMGNEEGDEEGEGKSLSDNGEETEEEGEKGNGKTEAKGENEEAEDGTEGGNEKGENSDEEADAEGESDGKGEEGEGGQNGKGGSVGNKPTNAPAAPTTTKALDEALSKMVKKSSRPILYADLPEVAENMVIPFKRVEQAYAAAAAKISGKSATVAAVYNAWKSKNASDVLALATEFERRKAADAHRRTVTAETGSIDPTRLFAYKVSDDIFLRSSTVQDGKNHGLVVLLDMSGSMNNQLLDTVVQLVNLAAFARRVNIPFKVYGFVDYDPKMADGTKPVWNIGKGAKAGWGSLVQGNTRLLTLLESGTTQQRFQNAAGGLLTWAASIGMGYGASFNNPYAKAIGNYLNKGESAYYCVWQHYGTEGFSLNGTPTNTALIALMSLVPQFKKEKNLQVVNTIILTDGEAGDQPLTDQVKYEYGKAQPLIVIRDPKTRREYKTWKDIKPSREGGETYQNVFYAREQQSLLVSMLRDRTGAKVININLVTGTRAAGFVIEAGVKTDEQRKTLRKQFSKEGWVSIPKTGGFDEVIALNTANASETEFDFGSVTVSDTDSKAGQKELQKAFVKSMESRKGNRPLMARIAELVSKNL